MLDKAIEKGKEKRKQYKGAKLVCMSCRNNGGCSYCEGNRKYKNEKRMQTAQQKANEYANRRGN